MGQLTTPLFNVEQIRHIEQAAIDSLGLSEAQLMERAGCAAFEHVLADYPDARRLAVFCGGGNNGGDGFVVARLAKQHGIPVTVYHLKDIDTLPPAALNAAELAVDAGVKLEFFDSDGLDVEADLIIDALLGIGLKGDVAGTYVTAIECINALNLPVMAMDCPSGLEADTGRCLGLGVHATSTLSFIGLKRGLLSAAGVNLCGRVHCASLGLDELSEQFEADVFALTKETVSASLPKRHRNSHKGQFGHVVLIGGDVGMQGAITLAATACLRVGAGLVSVATHPSHAEHVAVHQAEIMSYPIEHATELTPLLARASVCVLGPGLGLTPWGKDVFEQAITCPLPMVIDAGALSLLACAPQQDDNWCLTPHPGEAARLLSVDSSSIQADRFKAVAALQNQYGGVVVLKGAGTLIKGTGPRIDLSTLGNPGMSSAGMGDVLTGIIGGLLAQGLSLEQAAKVGVLCHGLAGDMASVSGERGLLASDLIAQLRQLVN